MSPRLAHMISLSQAQTFISKVLEVLGVIQDMTNTRPELRLSAEEASLQMRMAVENCAEETRNINLHRDHRFFVEYKPVPHNAN